MVGTTVFQLQGFATRPQLVDGGHFLEPSVGSIVRRVPLWQQGWEFGLKVEIMGSLVGFDMNFGFHGAGRRGGGEGRQRVGLKEVYN